MFSRVSACLSRTLGCRRVPARQVTHTHTQTRTRTHTHTISVRYVWSHLSGSLDAIKPNEQDLFKHIPIIDVTALVNYHPNHPQLSSTVSALRSACQHVGFFYVTNHGVSEQHLEHTFKEVKRFFDLPLSRKLEISCKDTPNRGYFDIGGENLGEKLIGDYKEGVDIGRVSTGKNEYQLPNRWPSNLPGWQQSMEAYFESMMILAMSLTRGLALAANIDRHFFDDKVDNPMASLRLTHYPPQDPKSVSEENLGAGPHTDYGVLTIVAQTESGLQVRNRASEWIAAPVIPGTLIVNLGDMLPRWTNGFFQSTPHRVINTSPVHRYSMPFFFEPNFDAVIETHPSYRDSSAERYPAVMFGKHLEHMYTHTYKKPGSKPPTATTTTTT